MDTFDAHSGEILILILASLVLGTLVILVPRLLQSHHRVVEMQHAERIKALEKGHPIPPID